MKKKLEGAYTPDKESRKERVVVGISGGLDSLVAAYLLKIQKYDVFAVTIVPAWDQFSGSKEQTLSCWIDDAKLELIREFANQLKIPLHIVKANAEFQENVVEEWMASKVTGSTSNACWTCHGVRMRLLYQKMLELDAKILATGHYAKLFHHAAHGTYYVHSSNDEYHDQSALLSRLPAAILSSLLLPLSDLTKKEVLKLGENFGLSVKERTLKMHQCFPNTDKTMEYLSSRVPKSMSRPGDFMNEDGTEMYGEHAGVIAYTFGEPVKTDGRKGESLFGQFSFKDKRIILTDEDHFKHERAHLTDCEFSEEVSWLEPMKAVIELGPDDYVDCWLFPKSLKSAFVEWEGPHKVIPGELVTVFRKKGKNSKVYLTGKIRLLPRPQVSNENDQEDALPEINYGIDF